MRLRQNMKRVISSSNRMVLAARQSCRAANSDSMRQTGAQARLLQALLDVMPVMRATPGQTNGRWRAGGTASAAHSISFSSASVRMPRDCAGRSRRVLAPKVS